MLHNLETLIKTKLSKSAGRSDGVLFTVYAGLTAFCLYTCVYAFRKTYTSATFDGMEYAGISYKVLLITAQVLGYGLAKFVGIKVISELPYNARATGILLMILIAGMAWLFFAIVPPPINIVFLFVNGFPLGMVWGMVFGYMEGRRMTEVLGAALSVSFIFSGGLCRSVGSFLITGAGISEMWMPFVSACIFSIPLLVFLKLVALIPPPSPLDEQLRTRRQPMGPSERKRFVTLFLPGIILFVLAYMGLTAFRDFRENFLADVWSSLGRGESPEIFTQTETPVSLIILVIMGSVMLIRDNKIALMVNHIIIIAGMITVGAGTWLFEAGLISAPLWMILIGTGLYMAYVPFNSMFFDRLIAAFRYVGTVGFIMYVADAFGYVGSVAVLVLKEFSGSGMSYTQMFIHGGYALSAGGSVLILASMWYFHARHKKLSDFPARENAQPGHQISVKQ